MDVVKNTVSLPYRDLAARISSIGALKYVSVYELLLTLLIVWALCFAVKTALLLRRSERRLYLLFRRLYAPFAAALYIASLFLWLWNASYYAASLAEKTGLSGEIGAPSLERAAAVLAARASELAPMMPRDEKGSFKADPRELLSLSSGLYANIEKELPALTGESRQPKPMIYSKLMSAAGFTGVYIALTGEANVNISSPLCLLPATIAHEMAHQRGVNFEEEANFAAVAACITSGIPVYEYSGALLGLMHLTGALYKTDPAAARRIVSSLDKYVLLDWQENSDYWARRSSSLSRAASSLYDGYLKSSGVPSGIASYGECVKMLSLWLEKRS